MRSAGHRGTSPESGHPSKKRKYVPGGPGGGGRYVQDEGRLAMLEREASSTGIASTGLRGRVGRLNTENAAAAVTPSLPSYPRPRRDRPPAGPRSSSAAAAAAAVAQSNDGYKPREERGWEEFHQDLDIEADVPVFTADQVDGVSPPDTESATPTGTGHVLSNGTTPKLEAQASAQAEDASNAAGELVNGAFATPGKRKAGRPPRRLDAMLSGLGSPPAPRINPLPTHNPKEKLNLPKPSYRQVDPFAAFEQDHSVQVNYVDRAMANLGYQESDVFITPEKTLIRAAEGSIEEDLDLAMQIDVDGSTGAVPIGRVEYDMDEQDDRWLEQLNAQRKEESAEAIKPAIFEVTVTQIEKEWHALEKRMCFLLTAKLHAKRGRHSEAKSKASADAPAAVKLCSCCQWRASWAGRRARYQMCDLRRRRLREHQCHRFLRRLRPSCSSRVLRRALYPGGPVALSAMPAHWANDPCQ